MTRNERRRLAVAAALRFAYDDPVTYDEIADAGDLRQRIVDAVDERLDREGAA